MSDNSTGTKDMRPHFEDIQAHYDLSDDFFGVFQDPTRKYSCAYFTGPNVTLSLLNVSATGNTLKVDGVNANIVSVTPGDSGTIVFATPKPAVIGAREMKVVPVSSTTDISMFPLWMPSENDVWLPRRLITIGWLPSTVLG